MKLIKIQTVFLTSFLTLGLSALVQADSITWTTDSLLSENQKGPDAKAKVKTQKILEKWKKTHPADFSRIEKLGILPKVEWTIESHLRVNPEAYHQCLKNGVSTDLSFLRDKAVDLKAVDQAESDQEILEQIMGKKIGRGWLVYQIDRSYQQSNKFGKNIETTTSETPCELCITEHPPIKVSDLFLDNIYQVNPDSQNLKDLFSRLDRFFSQAYFEKKLAKGAAGTMNLADYIRSISIQSSASTLRNTGTLTNREATILNNLAYNSGDGDLTIPVNSNGQPQAEGLTHKQLSALRTHSLQAALIQYIRTSPLYSKFKFNESELMQKMSLHYFGKNGDGTSGPRNPFPAGCELAFRNAVGLRPNQPITANTQTKLERLNQAEYISKYCGSGHEEPVFPQGISASNEDAVRGYYDQFKTVNLEIAFIPLENETTRKETPAQAEEKLMNIKVHAVQVSCTDPSKFRAVKTVSGRQAKRRGGSGQPECRMQN